MVEIKTAISFDEYNAIIDKVVNDCFPDGTYSPANYELSLRTALLCAFAPDYDLSGCDDNNALWERVMGNEADEIIDYISTELSGIKQSIKRAIWDNIDYRLKLLTSGSMSMTDIAISTLVDTLTKKVEQIDTSMLTKENMDTVIKAVNATQDGNFAESLVDTMMEKGMLAKPNRETRRKNGQRSKSEKPNITVTSKESDT